jgi:hypothetical protein
VGWQVGFPPGGDGAIVRAGVGDESNRLERPHGALIQTLENVTSGLLLPMPGISSEIGWPITFLNVSYMIFFGPTPSVLKHIPAKTVF